MWTYVSTVLAAVTIFGFAMLSFRRLNDWRLRKAGTLPSIKGCTLEQIRQLESEGFEYSAYLRFRQLHKTNRSNKPAYTAYCEQGKTASPQR